MSDTNPAENPPQAAGATNQVDLTQLHQVVKSKILNRIQQEFDRGALLASSTQYVKSDGTNYGMYTKSDDFSSLSNLWDVVFNQRGISPTQGPTIQGPTIQGGPTG